MRKLLVDESFITMVI